MTYLLFELWADESGSVLTAEAALLGTMGAVGAAVGLNMAADSVDQELRDVSRSIRHLDQSYEVAGFQGCRAQTAGSSFRQEDVKKSIRRLDEVEEDLESLYKKQEKARREHREELLEQLRKEAERERKRAEEEERRRRSKKRSNDDDDDD